MQYKNVFIYILYTLTLYTDSTFEAHFVDWRTVPLSPPIKALHVAERRVKGFELFQHLEEQHVSKWDDKR